jgi:hypothetical protein
LPGTFVRQLEAARDHEMNDEEQVLVQLPHQAFAEPAEAAHGLAVGVIDRWIEGADEKRTR